jgi:hypothetical protein
MPDTQQHSAGSWNRWAIKGLCISGLNPKVFLLFLALLPQFTDPRSWSVAQQMSALGGIHLITCTLVYLLVGYGAKALLATRPQMRKGQHRFRGDDGRHSRPAVSGAAEVACHIRRERVSCSRHGIITAKTHCCTVILH